MSSDTHKRANKENKEGKYRTPENIKMNNAKKIKIIKK
jgi:hypothetical protein